MWGRMPPFGDMNGGIGEDHVGEVVPAVFAGESVVLEDVRIDETVQVHVDE